MKTSAVLVGALASLASAQAAFPEGFPECGRVCIGNMLGLAPSLGCTATDARCLCSNQNFAFGIRDCSREACGNQEVANQVISYGLKYCADAGVAVNIPGVPAASGSVPPTTTIEATSPPPHSAGSEASSQSGAGESGQPTGQPSGSGGAGAGQGGVPISTGPIVVTSTASDGSLVTTTVGSTTIFSTAAPTGSGQEGLVPISTETIVSTGTNSAGSVFETTATSTIFSQAIATESSSAASGSGSQAPSESTIVTSVSTNLPVTSTNSQGGLEVTSVPTTVPTTTTAKPGFAAKQTAAPIGIIAAAGVAILLL